MKHAPLMFTALVPFAATAAPEPASLEGWRYEPLQDDTRASELLDRRVVSAGGQPMGDVRNILLDRDAKFEALSMEFDHAGGDAVALALFEWSDVAVRPDAVAVSLGTGVNPAAAPVAGQGMSLRQLIGLPVRLEGERFGEVQDVLFEADGDRATALLIDAGGKTYAVPASSLPRDAEWLDLPFTARDVRGLGEFNLPDAPTDRPPQGGRR